MEVEKGDEVLLAAPVSHCRRVGMGSIAGDSVLCTGLTGSGACLQEGTRSPVLSDKAALHRGGGVAAWRGGGLVVCYGWLSSAHGGRGRQSAKCIESSDRFGLQGRRRTRGVPAGCACNLSSEDRLWALKPALACCVPLHGTYPCWIKPVRRHLGLVLSSFSLHRVGAAVARGGRERYGVAAGCRRRAVLQHGRRSATCAASSGGN